MGRRCDWWGWPLEEDAGNVLVGAAAGAEPPAAGWDEPCVPVAAEALVEAVGCAAGDRVACPADGDGLGRPEGLGATTGGREWVVLDPDEPVVKIAITPASAMRTLAAPRLRTTIGEGCIANSQPGPAYPGL